MRITAILLTLFLSGCLSGKVWEKAYPGPMQAAPGQIASVSLGQDGTIRFELKDVSGSGRFVCFRSAAEAKLLQGPVRSGRGVSCEGFAKVGDDLALAPLPDPNSILALPDGVDSLFQMKGNDEFNFLMDNVNGYRYFPARPLEKAEISEDGRKIYLFSRGGEYVLLRRAVETPNYVKYIYDWSWRISESEPGARADRTGAVPNEFGDNGHPLGPGRRQLERIPITRRLLVLYFYSQRYMEGGSKMLLVLPDGFRPEVRFTHHVHVVSLQDESHPAYLLLLPATVPLDVVTSPFQAIYYLVGFAALGQLAH